MPERKPNPPKHQLRFLPNVALTSGHIDTLQIGFSLAGIAVGALGLTLVWSALFGDDVAGVVVGLLSALLDFC